MQPIDVVLGACGDQHCTDAKVVLAPTVSSQDKDSTHFVLREVLTWRPARLLIDTGVTTSYVSSQFVNDFEQLTTLRTDTAPISVRLGNNTVQIVKEQTTTDIWIGKESYTTTFLIMPLPSGVGAILGMDWLSAHDKWLHPASTCWYQANRVQRVITMRCILWPISAQLTETILTSFVKHVFMMCPPNIFCSASTMHHHHMTNVKPFLWEWLGLAKTSCLRVLM